MRIAPVLFALCAILVALPFSPAGADQHLPIIARPTLRPPLPITGSSPLPRRAGPPIAIPRTPSPQVPNPGSSNPPGSVLQPTQWHLAKGLPPLKHVPKLSQFLSKTGRFQLGVRKVAPPNAQLHSNLIPQAASGATIVMTGDNTSYFENDVTLSYGTLLYLICENMPVRAWGRYEYVVFPPDGSGPYASGTVGMMTDSGNNECTTYGLFNLSTPFGGFNNTGTNGVAYPGVWVVAMYDRTLGQYVTETNIVVDSAINFTTYSDQAESTPAIDFAPGGTIAVGVTGLNPNHYYAIGWVYTAAGGMPCEYAVPAVTGTPTGACFRGTVTGVQAFGGNIEAWWNASSVPSTSTAPAGTYDVELYDTTTSDMIGHQQISVESSNVAWTLTPYSASGATPPPGLNYNNTYATDGLLDPTNPSVTGLTYMATGLPATSSGHTLRLSISDPNGVVLTGPNTGAGGFGGGYGPGGPTMNVVPTVTQSGTTATLQEAFPLDVTEQMAYGPTQTAYAPNVFTAQLYDTTLGTVLASKSFRVLSFGGTYSWNGASIPTPAPGSFVNETLTFQNTGDQSYGSWNGDGINGIELSADPLSTNLQIGLVDTTATDSAGNIWTITSTGSGTNLKIWATPSVVGTALPIEGTLSFTIGVDLPVGSTCASAPCHVLTAVRPLHGIAYSNVTNSLPIVANGTNPNSIVATGSWAVVGESATANMAARVADFAQLAYVLGVANAPSTDYYTLNLTINNASSPSSEKLMDLKLAFPPGLDINALLQNGARLVSPASGWCMETNGYGLGTGCSGFGNTALGYSNNLELACRGTSNNACGIASGNSLTFQIRMPLFTGAFAEQQIPMTANWDGGCGGTCTLTSYSLNPTTTTVNGIAGISSVNSLELGAFDLNPNLMSMLFSPSTVGTGVATSATMVFENTSTQQSANPDYVDQINLVIPSGMGDPASISVPTGWVATKTSALHWQIALCSNPTNTAPCSTNETNAVAPGASLNIVLNYNSPGPPAGTYNVQWYATGANGGEDTHLITTNATVTFSATAATAAFTSVNGTAVSSGTEPSVGTDATSNGSTFTYVITNSGKTNITAATITIPHTTRSGISGADGSGKYWTVSSASTVLSAGSSGTGGTCSGTISGGQITNPTSGADGSIKLTGCTLAPGGTITVTLVMQAPYLIYSDFLFPTTVTGTGNIAAQPTYSSADAMKIAEDGFLSILTPGAGAVGGANVLVAATGSGATPATSCSGCSVATGSPTTVDFGSILSTFTATDIMDASVTSDANSPNAWSVYVEASSNPSNMLYAEVDSARSTAAAGLTFSNNSAFAIIPTTSPGLPLSTYTGTARRLPSDSILNYQIQTGGITTPETTTLTFTLIFN